MKKAITILAICSLLLTACGHMDDTKFKPETTVTTSSESSAYDYTASTSAEEKDTSETTTIKTESSQSVSSASKPVSTEKTAVPKSDPSNSNGNPNQGQNNSVQNNNDQEDISQKNDQPAQNNQQILNNSPSDNSQSNNGAEQNDRPSDNKPQNNTPSPPTTTAKPVVTDPPDTAAPKPQTTVPPTEPPAPEPTEEERYMDIGRNLLHDGSDYSKAEAVYNWMTENGSGTCVNYSWQTYYLCKGVGLECCLAWTPSKLYGHVANVVKVNGTQFILDTQGHGFLMNNDCGFSEIIDIDESYISSADAISSQRYDEVY